MLEKTTDRYVAYTFQKSLELWGNYYKAIAGKIKSPFWQDVFLTFHQFRDIIELMKNMCIKMYGLMMSSK